MSELKLTKNPCKYCNGEIDEGKPLCGDEYWCECNKGMPERDRRSFGCEKWEAK
jgi:hypothetical protein